MRIQFGLRGRGADRVDERFQHRRRGSCPSAAAARDADATRTGAARLRGVRTDRVREAAVVVAHDARWRAVLLRLAEATRTITVRRHLLVVPPATPRLAVRAIEPHPRPRVLGPQADHLGLAPAPANDHPPPTGRQRIYESVLNSDRSPRCVRGPPLAPRGWGCGLPGAIAALGSTFSNCPDTAMRDRAPSPYGQVS